MPEITVLPALHPLELVNLTLVLDGSAGTNRAHDNHAQIAADNDIDAIKAWLACVFRANWPPIPVQTGHSIHGKPATPERSDAGGFSVYAS